MDANAGVRGVIGLTNDGYPIILPEHCCGYFEPDANCSCNLRECWYCRYADFRKSNDITLENSVCRNPRNRVGMRVPQKDGL